MAQEATKDIHVITKEIVINFLPRRIPNSNKGSYGHVLNIAGSSQFSGAAYLSSVAPLKVGAGYSMLASCSDVICSISNMTPDVIFYDLGQSAYGTIPKDANKAISSIANCDVISLGCGLTQCDPAADFVVNFLKKNKNSYTPIILDADALNIISATKTYLFPSNSIITPHPMELSRLLGVDISEIEANRAKWAWEACREFDCVVLLKGHETVIAIPNGKIFINHTGNSSLSKAGSGDVLTGMIAGFCSQGITVANAACCAAYIHGLAGEIASKSMTEYCVLASDILKYIPLAFKALFSC